MKLRVEFYECLMARGHCYVMCKCCITRLPSGKGSKTSTIITQKYQRSGSTKIGQCLLIHLCHHQIRNSKFETEFTNQAHRSRERQLMAGQICVCNAVEVCRFPILDSISLSIYSCWNKGSVKPDPLPYPTPYARV